MSELVSTAAIPKTARQLDKERRERDAARKRAQRDAARELGIPRGGHVDAAIVEAVAFALMAAQGKGSLPTMDWFPVNLAVVVAVAEDILVDRYRYDRQRSHQSVRDKLASRPEHRGVDYVPTTAVRPGEMGYRTAPPLPIANLVRIIRNSTPVTSSGRVQQRATAD